jgi:serine/threonine-protein kinase
MLYELLTGVVPFDGKDTASTLLKIIHEPPPPLSTYIKNYPAELDEVIKRALAKDREERYATAEDFAFDLSRVQEQLKKQLVSDYVARAKSSIEKADLAKAKEILQIVLKVDTQHQVAKELMQEVQQRLQRQVRGEQIKQLRANAEEAMSQKSYQDALAYAEQALTLDKSNTELINLRDLIAAAKAKKEKLEAALRRAEANQAEGNIESALKAAEEALAADPDNTQAKGLQASLAKELADRARQVQLRGLLDEARKDISARKFTAAFEVLKKAESLDATSPEIAALMNLATQGREQEARRRDLEKFTNEIEDALARENYTVACAKVDEGLQKFPSEPSLLKLKALAEKQRDAGEKKKFVEEQMAAARKLLDAGKPSEAIALLEKASTRVPGDARLRSLLAIVRESAEQEKTEKLKSDFIQKANEARRKKDFAGAIKILEAAQMELEGSSEIQELLQLTREEAASFDQRRKVDAAAEEAQRLINEEEYEQAVSVLENVLKQAPNEELKVLMADAIQRVEEYNRKVASAVSRAQKLMELRKFDEAASFLESQPKSFARQTEYTAALEKARSESDQLKNVTGAIEKAKEALAKGDFNSALNILQACKKTYGETPEVKAALADLETKRVAAAKTKLDKAIKDARTLLLARQYAPAMKELEMVGPLVSAGTPDQQKQYESLKKDAAAGMARKQKEADLDKTLVSGSDTAQTMVHGSSYASGTNLTATARAAAAAAAPAPAHRAPVVAPPPPKKSPVPYVVIAVLAVVVLVGGYFFMRKPSGGGTGGAAVSATYIEINAVPYGTVKTITSDKGKTIAVNQETPVRVPVGPGTYTVEIAGPDGSSQSAKVTVSADSPGSVTPVFEKIDVQKILQSN